MRFAIRQLRKAPAFALTAILTLALGIGVNTSIFTLIESIVLRPLPFPHQDRLMRIGYGGGQTETAFFPKGWIRAMAGHSREFAAISAYGPNAESNVGEADASSRQFGAAVMANAFDTLDIHPAAGRFFSQEDSIAGHDPVVVLGYGFWRTHYAASPDVIGTTLRIDGISRRILGVMPEGVRFPYAETQFVVPVVFKGGDPLDPWESFDLRAFGRLRDGAAPMAAQAELRNMQKFLLPLFPWRMPDIWASDMTVVPLLESQVGPIRPRLLLLFAAAGLILLIACANVANLMLARAAGREREIAIRGALGATTTRLIRQLLCESTVLGIAAGGAGLLAAALSLRAVVWLMPSNTPRGAEVALHWPVFLFAACVAVLTGLLFGLVPALRMASPNLRDSLHAGSRSVAGRSGQFRISMLLVMAQIALSVVVITGAGLMLHSLWRLSQIDPGFRGDHVMTAEVSLDVNACQAKGYCHAFFDTLLQRLNGAAGIQSAALADSLPMQARQGNYVYDAEGHPRDARQGAMLATGRVVTPGYFGTLALTLLRGRLLQPEDTTGTSRAIVINQELADQLWPHEDPIGKHLLNVNDEPAPAVWMPAAAVEVVGVVNNTHEAGLAAGFGGEVYLPFSPQREQSVLDVLVWSRMSPERTAAELRQVVADLDPQVPVTRVQSLNDVVGASESNSRSLTLLLLGFGTLALAIGGVGVYSLIAYVVSWRTREIGIRLALGAQRWQIVQGIVRQSLVLAAGGSVAGLMAAAFLTRMLRNFLFDVSALDPLTYGSVAAVMIALALIAAWIPARRAAYLDPIRTLRME